MRSEPPVSAGSSAAPADPHECSVCHKVFSRQEHLRRHFLTHDHVKPHVCDVCHRAYSRPDVLLRHKATHHPEEGAGEAEAETGAARRIDPEGDRFRACRECALARVRCSGREPCARCARTGKACAYPEARNRRGGSSARTSTSPMRSGEWRSAAVAGAVSGGAGGAAGMGVGLGQGQGQGYWVQAGSAMSSRPPSPAPMYNPHAGSSSASASAMQTRQPSPAYHPHAQMSHPHVAPSYTSRPTSPTYIPPALPHPHPQLASSNTSRPASPTYLAHPPLPPSQHPNMHPENAAPLAFPTEPTAMYPMAAPGPSAPPPLPPPSTLAPADPLGMLTNMPPLPEYAAADLSALSSTVARTSALPPNWLGDLGTMWDDLLQYQDLFSFAPDEGFGTGGINWLVPAQAGQAQVMSMPGLNQWDGAAGLEGMQAGIGGGQAMAPPAQVTAQTHQSMQPHASMPTPSKTAAPGPGQTLPPHLPSILNMSAVTTPVGTPVGGGGAPDHASTGVSSTRSKYYVGGDGGRAPQLKRPIRKRAMKAQIFMASRSQRVPDVNTYHPDISPEWVSPEMYHGMRLDLLANEPGPAGKATHPTLADFNLFVQSYLDEYHTSLPLFRRSEIKAQRYTPLELLTIAAIGAGHIGVNPARRISLDLHQAVRRALEADAMPHPSMRRGSRRHELGQLRAQLLNVLGMFHSGERELVGYAFAGRAALVAACLQLRLLEPVIRPSLDEHSAQAKQRNFLNQQERSRIGYGIWLVDCMIAYQTDMRPLLTLQDANAPMPCSDTLWEDVEAKWPVIANGQRVPASLREALETLYTEKRIMYNCTDVGRTIMIHGIYQRTWEVEKLNQDVVATWKLTGRSTNGVSARRKSASAAQATIAEWRNSGCDCLDVLHFAANIRVASATGLEHPLILHLHLSRIILLTPVRQMHELVISHTPETRLDTYEEVLKWALQDQYKARLAVLHAASVFWHVRRYSCDNVIEPYSIYVATLTLWIYSISRIVTKQAGYEVPKQDPQYQEDTEPLEFDHLNLDRPCDDESGMAWIRSGDLVDAHIYRVGPICKPGAPDKILKEGARLLSKQDGNTGSEAAFVWGCSETYLRDLTWFRQCLAQHRVGD